jgi:hypothetical protein
MAPLIASATQRHSGMVEPDMSESSPREASPASAENAALIVQRWGPAIIRAQPSQLARSFPLSFGPALAGLALGTFLACVSHWAWALAAIAAGLWIGRRVEVLQAPFLFNPLQPALVRDASRCELLVLLEFAAHEGELFATVMHVVDSESARWLRRYRCAWRL